MEGAGRVNDAHRSSSRYRQYEADANIGQVFEKMLADAPKITGSEGNGEVFVNVSWTQLLD